MADEIKNPNASNIVSSARSVQSRASQAKLLKAQQSLAVGWLRGHQNTVGYTNYAKPAQAKQALGAMSNKVVAAFGGATLASSHVKMAQAALAQRVVRAGQAVSAGHISEADFNALGSGDAALSSVWDLLPFDVAQKILQQRGDAIMKSLMEWGEDIRKNAKLAKEASEKAQQHAQQEKSVEVTRAAAKYSNKQSRDMSAFFSAAKKLVRAASTGTGAISIEPAAWTSISDVFEGRDNLSPILTRGAVKRKAPEPEEPEANENTGVRISPRAYAVR